MISVDLGSIPSHVSSVRDALIDLDINAVPGELLPFTYKRQNARLPLITTPHYSKWEIFSSLPLTFGRDYSSGLTLYWEVRLIGMASYGPQGQRRSVGRCEGNAMHFPLAPGEVFTSLWARHSHEWATLFRPFILTVSTVPFST